MQLDPIERAYLANKRAFPTAWTRYLGLDPGFSTCAALLFVVPPPAEFGRRVIIENEVYLHHATAETLAKQLVQKMEGYVYEAFVIDFRAGRQHTMTGGPRIIDQYAHIFARHGLESKLTGNTFLPGSDNVAARSEKVRSWLARDSGPILRIVAEKCPNTENEFSLYKRVLKKEAETDKPIDQHNHAMNVIEYMAMYDPQYVAPDPAQQVSPYMKAYRKYHADMNALAGVDRDSSIHLGPTAPTLT